MRILEFLDLGELLKYQINVVLNTSGNGEVRLTSSILKGSPYIDIRYYYGAEEKPTQFGMNLSKRECVKFYKLMPDLVAYLSELELLGPSVNILYSCILNSMFKTASHMYQTFYSSKNTQGYPDMRDYMNSYYTEVKSALNIVDIKNSYLSECLEKNECTLSDEMCIANISTILQNERENLCKNVEKLYLDYDIQLLRTSNAAE